ncbi:MAG: hypothetical protein JWM91_2618 [Rhodospirillales bacterium]|nr:hypothetical protein [Rhodospirillales bacterium]
MLAAPVAAYSNKNLRLLRVTHAASTGTHQGAGKWLGVDPAPVSGVTNCDDHRIGRKGEHACDWPATDDSQPDGRSDCGMSGYLSAGASGKAERLAIKMSRDLVTPLVIETCIRVAVSHVP